MHVVLWQKREKPILNSVQWSRLSVAVVDYFSVGVAAGVSRESKWGSLARED